MTGALAVEQILGVHAIQQKSVAGIALAVGPDGLVAQAGVGARSRREFRANARGKNRQSRETSSRQRDGFQFCFIEDVAVRRIHRVEQRSFLHGDGRAHLADLQRRV